MKKTHRTISLTTDVEEDIKKRVNGSGFVFSDWVEDEYRKQFMDAEAKEAEITRLHERITTLQQEVLVIKDRRQAYSEIYREIELRFVAGIPLLISEKHCDWKGITARFNNSFGRQLTVKELQSLTEVVKRERSQRRG